MHFKNFILVGFLSLICSVGAFAQDFHYTQYFHSPLGVNPALAGSFNGSYRINGVYRSQYFGIAKDFAGYSLNVDAPIVRGIRKQDWIGIGLRLESNEAGRQNQKLNIYGLGASYHLSLDKKQTSVISFGLQYGTGGYSYTTAGDKLAAQHLITGTQPSMDELDFIANNSASSTTTQSGGSLNDLSIGALYKRKNPKSGSEFQLGLGLDGVLNPNRASLGSQDGKGIGINAFTSYEFVLTRRASLTSGAYYYSNKKASAVNVNSILNYQMKPDNALTLHTGVGLRNARAGLIYLGASIKDIRVGVAFDLDLSSSSIITNSSKSIELAVSYLGKIYKKPKPKPIIYCPRL